MTFIITHYRTRCPELSTLQKYQKTQLWCCRTSRGIAHLKTLMHITRSMPLQQQNHEKLQVFHGDTKFKVCRTAHRMFIHLPDPKTTKRHPATSIFDLSTLHKWNKVHYVIAEVRRLWKAQATAHVPLLKWTKNFSSLSTPNFDPTHRPIARVIDKINHDTYMPKNSSRCSLKYGFRCDLLCN
jgi:hypothetical protein